MKSCSPRRVFAAHCATASHSHRLRLVARAHPIRPHLALTEASLSQGAPCPSRMRGSTHATHLI